MDPFRFQLTLLPSLGILLLVNMLQTSRGLYTAPKIPHKTSLSAALSNSFTIFYNDIYKVPLPPHHRFPMEKYRKVRMRVQEYIEKQQQQGKLSCPFLPSPLVHGDELATTHCPRYIERFLQGNMTEEENRNVGFPWSPAGVNRALSSVGGTVQAARTVWKNRGMTCWAAHVAGGTHHAFYDRGEGFCVFSDMAVAANILLHEDERIESILLLDLDVHQGNGNAVLFNQDPRVTTVSLHCAANYFSERQTSDLDVELPAGCSDSTYLATLHHWLGELRKRKEFDLIFFQAGVDGLAEDRLGRMELTLDGLRRRNDMVYQYAFDTQCPLVICMGGGYPRNDNWEPVLKAHTQVYTQAYDYIISKIGR